MVSYPPVFNTLKAQKAAVIPTKHESLDPRKLIELITGFIEPTFDTYL